MVIYFGGGHLSQACDERLFQNRSGSIQFLSVFEGFCDEGFPEGDPEGANGIARGI